MLRRSPLSSDALAFARLLLIKTYQWNDVAEVRLFCETTRHNRQVHFKTSSGSVRRLAFQTGIAPLLSDWNHGFTPLEGHSGHLPETTNQVPRMRLFL